MSTLVGGTGIIGQDIFCSFGNGKYTTFEGTEIVAENCLKARVKDLVVEGKTYQNLLNGIRKVNPLWSETDDSYSLDIQTGQPMITHYSTLIKPLTTYTLIINITDYTTGIIHIGMRNNTNDTTIQVASNERQVQGKGVRKVTLTTKDTIVDPYIRIFPRGGVQNTYSISKNILLLEGNYVNTDLPTSIDGIESVAERENNVLNIVNSGKNIYNPNNLVSQSGNVGETIFPPFTPILERNKVIFRDVSKGGIACKFYAHKNDILYLSGTVENLTNIRIFTESANFQGMGIANFIFDGRKTELNPNKNNVCIPEDGYYYIRCWIHVRPEDAILTNFMAQLNSQYSYEPYRDPTITTINLPFPLRSLPNGTCDTVEGNTLVQRVGKVILDGSQSINKSTIAYHENVARVQWKNTNLKIGRDNSYCDKFPYGNNDNDTQHYKLGTAVNTAFFYIPIEYTNNISSYFEENPTTLYYELAEPIIHDLTVPQLSTAKGTNIITCDNNIKPKISMKVKAKKNVRKNRKQ